MTNIRQFKSLALILLGGSALSACTALDRVANVGQAPEMSSIANPTTQQGYQPVSLPMPAPKTVKRQRNSLWASDRSAFFDDQRAKDIGDIITVTVNIEDEAEIENESERTRSSNEDSNLNSILGYEAALSRVLPEAIDTARPDIAAFDSSSTHNGTGSIEREEEITVRLAALVTQILPNGNMVINGRQEVLVNFEKRILQVDGVIRPEDITIENTIAYDKIAEARIVYGGEGQITDVQQPRYGQQLYDIFFPF